MIENLKSTLPRSFMYVPANKAELFPKAYSSDADALILDLEDAVAVAEKQTARAALYDWLGLLQQNTGRAPETGHRPDSGGSATSQAYQPDGVRPQLWARINAESIDADLEAVVYASLTGIFLAKTSSDNIEATDRALAFWEGKRGLPLGSLGVIGLIESAASLRDADAIASHPRLLTFGVGEVDLLADMRMSRAESTGPAVDYLRVQLVVAAAAAGMLPPVAPTSTAIRDLEGFDASSRHLHALGFRSRTAIHPSQLAVIHEIFTPSSEDIREAQELVDRFHRAAGGVVTDASGRMIDLAVVRAARETLERAATNR